VTRLTYTLTQLGYLSHIERLSKYQLAPAALALGYATLANMRIRQIARPHMQALANYSGGSVALGSRDRLSLLYVEHCRAKSTVMLRLDLGSRIPIATTAMGRALIAAVPEKEREFLMRHIARREGKSWPKVRTGIERAVKDLATRGFTLSVGDWQRDVAAVGAVLMPADGSGLFAFNCGAPAFHSAARGSRARSARVSSTWCAISRSNSAGDKASGQATATGGEARCGIGSDASEPAKV
jgi:DNA-binding IclR family transcriptional regulator